jgi:glucan biosynthesis protein
MSPSPADSFTAQLVAFAADLTANLVASGGEPVDLRCYLRDAGGALSETWLYQWLPPPPARG